MTEARFYRATEAGVSAGAASAAAVSSMPSPTARRAQRHKRLWNGGNGVGTIELYDRHGDLVDRIHAENIGCEYGEYES